MYVTKIVIYNVSFFSVLWLWLDKKGKYIVIIIMNEINDKKERIKYHDIFK